jgi:hypothetical protein
MILFRARQNMSVPAAPSIAASGETCSDRDGMNGPVIMLE